MRGVEEVELADKFGDRSKAFARFDGRLRVVLKEPDGVEDLSIELRSEKCGRSFQMLALALGIRRGHALRPAVLYEGEHPQEQSQCTADGDKGAEAESKVHHRRGL
jgi:hypothetical protein